MSRLLVMYMEYHDNAGRRVRTNRHGNGASQRNPGIVNGESDPTETKQAILPAQLVFPTGRIDGDTVFDRGNDPFCWTS